MLDGWRGILLVLAAHLLPLGPKSWELNSMAAPMGMALFFTLSGFLIIRLLLQRPDVSNFLIRRVFRIVPLAWLAMAIAFPFVGTPASDYLPNFLFYANLPPQHLTDLGSHLWSLCVEMQFYIGVADLVAVGGRRGLFLLPWICLAVTAHRVATGTAVDIVTWRRVDEILAGATLALIHANLLGRRSSRFESSLNPYALIVLLALASHPSTDWINYFRPYVAALLVGTTLLNPTGHLAAMLKGRTLRYIAAVSYALYVVHHLLIYTWLGEGDKWVKYLKRPLLIGTTFALAHLSTFHFEKHWIEFGRRLAAERGRKKAASAAD